MTGDSERAMMSKKSKEKLTRRDLIKKAAYVAPVILTLAVNPSFARAGSDGKGKSNK